MKNFKNINISTEKGIEKLQNVLDEIQSKSRVRTVTAKNIAIACNNIISELDIPKIHIEDTKVIIDLNAQDFPNAYKGIPESTKVCAIYKNRHWTVTDVYRGKCFSSYHKANLTLSESAKEAIVNRFSSLYRI